MAFGFVLRKGVIEMLILNGAQGDLDSAIRKRMPEKGMAFKEALEAVVRENPGLYEAARREALSEKEPIFHGEERPVTSAEPAHFAQKKLVCLSEERAREKGLAFHKALTEIARERPDLAAEERQESLRE